jgi:hypothetical protein
LKAVELHVVDGGGNALSIKQQTIAHRLEVTIASLDQRKHRRSLHTCHQRCCKPATSVAATLPSALLQPCHKHCCGRNSVSRNGGGQTLTWTVDDAS